MRSSSGGARYGGGGGGSGLLATVLGLSELLPRNVGLSANWSTYSGGSGGVMKTLLGGAYGGKSWLLGLVGAGNGLDSVVVEGAEMVVNGEAAVGRAGADGGGGGALFGLTLRFVVVVPPYATLLNTAAMSCSCSLRSKTETIAPALMAEVKLNVANPRRVATITPVIFTSTREFWHRTSIFT